MENQNSDNIPLKNTSMNGLKMGLIGGGILVVIIVIVVILFATGVIGGKKTPIATTRPPRNSSGNTNIPPNNSSGSTEKPSSTPSSTPSSLIQAPTTTTTTTPTTTTTIAKKELTDILTSLTSLNDKLYKCGLISTVPYISTMITIWKPLVISTIKEIEKTLSDPNSSDKDFEYFTNGSLKLISNIKTDTLLKVGCML